MGTYYTRGLILGHQNWREVDRLVMIYSKEYGMVNVLARGSRKITSKLAGSLEPLAIANFIIAHGKQYDTITAVEVIQSFRQVKGDLDKMEIAGYLCAIVRKTSSGRQRDLRIFSLLQEVLLWLEKEKTTNKTKEILIWYFIWQYLAYLGYQAELYHCLICQHSIQPTKNYFSFKKGGLVCQKCRLKITQPVFISNNVIKILRLIKAKDYQKIRTLKISQQIIRELDKLTGNFINYTLEQDLRAEKFLLRL